MAAPSCFAVFLFVLMLVPFSLPAKKNKMSYVLTVDDHKEFKKILRTRTNVLSLFAKSEKAASPIMDTFAQVAEDMKGLGTLVFVDCSDKEAKKLCKKVKSNPATYELKHYKDGDFNKGYDRQETYKSMMNFLRDPTGDIPWEEDPTAKDVIHVDSDKALNRLVKKEKTPILMMFYAPWCGHCKRLKPDYAAAATELKGQATLAGMDVDKPENEAVRRQFNITGFPTILYFENGKQKYKYGGENNKQGIIDWMKDPQPPVEKAPEPEWSDADSDVVHLTDETFDTYIEEHASVLVMFYAPWCGHCKKMKPEYDEAATTLKQGNIDGILAAVDATKSPQVAKRFEVKGYPTVKYFKDGEEAFGFNDRTADKIVDFMKDPQEPPPPPPPEQPWQEVESEVVHLGDEDFKSQLKRRKHALVMFYAPWCGHCKKAKPEFTSAAEKYKDDTKVTFAAVDCTTQQGVCGQYEVRGYPTIKYFNYGKNPKDYEGGREEADFVAFMSDPLNPTPPTPPPKDPAEEWAELEGAEEVVHLHDNTFEEFIQQQSSVLVMFYAPWCGHCKAMKPDYALAAKALKEDEIPGVLAAVDATVDRVLQSKYDITGFPTLKHFKDGEFNTDYNKARTMDALVEFMKNPQKAPPPPPPEPEWSEVESEVNHLTDETFNSFIQQHSSVLVMFYAPWCGHCKKMKPAYQEAAELLMTEKPDAKLAAVDATKYSSLGTKYEVRGYPTIKYFKNGEMAFQYQKGRTTEDIVAFMKDPKETKPPPPEKEWSEEPSDVVHLTDATFATYTQEHSPVLVMFYAPWCGHCKRAKPEYVKAAELLKTDGISATLAAVDCTKHSEVCQTHDVKGYPTFKLVKDGAQVSDYNLGRTSEDFVAFMLNSLPKQPKEEAKPEEQKKDEPTQQQKQPEKKVEEQKKEEPKKEAEKPAEELKERPKRETPTDEWASTDSAADVNFLTAESFDQFVADHNSVLVMFYAPWCGHCKRMKPAFEEAATILKSELPTAKLAALDATQFRDIGTKYEVRGYPTILYFKNGQKEFKYTMGRATQDLVKFMKNPQAPPPPPPPEAEWSEVPSEINHLTDQTFDNFVYRHSSVLVMFYAPWCGHCKRMKPAYQEAAEQLKKEKPEAKLAAVDATKYKELGQKYGVRGYPTLKYFKNGKVASDYNKGRSKDDIVAFMKTPQTPPKAEEPKEEKPAAAEGDGWESGDVHHLTADNFNSFMQQHHSVLVMFYAPWCGHCKKMKPAYVEAAEQLKKEKPEAKLAAVDATQYGDLAKNYEVRGYPTLKYFQDGKEAFAYKKGRTTNELVSFMKDPQAPPPPPPPEPEWSEVESEVNHLTDETFNSFIQQHSSVLVMFYAPWCGHCKRMKPAYQEAAETLKTSDPAAKLAAVDATKYAALGKTYGVRGYPTIKYFRNGEDIQKYQGARDANSLVQFMKSPPTAAAPEWLEHPGAVVTPIKNIPAFDKFVQSHEHSLILFYKKELQKYREAKGPFQKTATAFKDDNNKQFAVVDCEAATDLCLRVGIIPEALPTIKFYVSGKFSTNYKDPVTNADLYNFMNTASTIPKTDAREEL
ncbi:uncharacterized protein LOC144905411 isoform X1 [Branchiostoma floridae x Branchiostoma belcheri]